MTGDDFQLPIAFDLGATFIFAVTGALAAQRRGCDIVGLFFLALASSLSGGLIRAVVFVSLTAMTPLTAMPAALATIGLTFLLRF